MGRIGPLQSTLDGECTRATGALGPSQGVSRELAGSAPGVEGLSLGRVRGRGPGRRAP